MTSGTRMRMTLRLPASRTAGPAARGLQISGPPDESSIADHCAEPAHVYDCESSVAGRVRTRALADRAGARRKRLVHDLEDLQRRRAGDRISGKRSAESARLGRIHDLRLSDDRGERKPSAQRLTTVIRSGSMP